MFCSLRPLTPTMVSVLWQLTHRSKVCCTSSLATALPWGSWQLAHWEPVVSALCGTLAAALCLAMPAWHLVHRALVSATSNLRFFALCGLWHDVQSCLAGACTCARFSTAPNSSWHPRHIGAPFVVTGPGFFGSALAWQIRQSPDSKGA